MNNNVNTAEAARDAGIARVAQSSGAAWQRRAAGYVREYAARATAPFLAEQVREYADAFGFEAPPNLKAWGAVMQSARREGVIRACGYAPANSSNRSPKVLWVRT